MKSLANLLLILTTFLFPFAASAQGLLDEEFDNNGEINAAFGLQGWFSQADAKWQISFPYTTDAGVPGTIESRLDYRKIDSPLIIGTMGGDINPEFSVAVVYGFGSITGGLGSDTDRFVTASGGGVEFSQSSNSLDGDVKLWGIDFSYNNKRYSDKPYGPWGLVFGFLHYEDDLTMSNGAQVVSIPFDGNEFPPPGPFAGLASTYRFSWNMLKAGITRRAVLGKGFSYSAALSIYPFVNYRGEGYWNLRAGTDFGSFRVQSPNFIQQSTSGYGFDADLGLVYRFTESLHLLAGYRYFSLYANDGTDTTYFSPASPVSEVTSRLDWVALTRQGAYTELLLRF